jgi:hypothetical protein
MTVDGILEVLRDNPELAANAPHCQEEIGHINAKRAVHAATPAHITFRMGYSRAVLDKVAIYLAFLLDHFP